MKISIAFLFLLVFADAYGQTAQKSAPQTCAVFTSFRSSLAKLTKKFGPKSPPGINADIALTIKSIRENVNFLEKVMDLEKPVPKEYLAGVSLDAVILKKLATRPSQNLSQRRTLSAGLKELDSNLLLKITGPRAGGRIARVVEIFVHAKKGAVDMGGYQVWYVPKFFDKNPSRYKPFDRLTDPSKPTSMKLAPGNYFIWLTKRGSATGRQPASIGENGETQRVIHVPVN